MARRRCIEPGCSETTPRTRCPTHERALAQQRGYTAEHRLRHIHARKQLTPMVNTGQARCSRCGETITPNPHLPGDGWHADQRPWGFEPAHSACNERAGALHQP